MLRRSVSKDFAYIWSIARHYCFIRLISALFRRMHERKYRQCDEALDRALCRVARVAMQNGDTSIVASAFARCPHQSEFVLRAC